MKNLINILATIAMVVLTGCAGSDVLSPGIYVYEPGVSTSTGKDGVVKSKDVSVKVLRITSDLAGVESVNYKDLSIKFGKPTVSQYAIYNKKGDYVGVVTKTDVPGVYNSTVIASTGEATKKIIDSFASGITGAILSFGGPIALGSGISAIPIK